jgi:hypothetical protein
MFDAMHIQFSSVALISFVSQAWRDSITLKLED